MKLFTSISAIVIVLAAFLTGFCQEDKEVIASGTANVVGGNTMGARQSAIAIASRAAVEIGLGTLVESATLTANFQLVSDKIYSKSQGYVKTYEVINEGPGDTPDTYKVTIKAIVNLTDMGNDLRALGILQDMMGMPKIMSMIDEVSTTSGLSVLASDPSSSIAMEEKLLGRGFELVDKDMVANIRAQEFARMGDAMGGNQAAFMENLIDNDEAVLRIAKEASQNYGAQYLLLGLSKIDPYSSSGGMKISTATFKAKVVDASTGEKLATTQKAESGNGASWAAADMNAGRRSGEVVADVIIPQIIQNWTKRSQQGALYIVKLYGVESYGRQGRKFISMLKGIPGVTNAVQRLWDAKLGRLEVDVTFKGGDAESLISGIFDNAYDIPGFDNFDLEQTQGNNLNFKVK